MTRLSGRRSRSLGRRQSGSPAERFGRLNLGEEPVEGEGPENRQDGDGGRDDPTKFVRKLLDNQQNHIASLLEETKKELFDKVDRTKKHTFRQKHLEKQFEVNESFLKLTSRSLTCVERGHYSKAKKHLRALKEELEEHSEDVIAADFSRYGWLTVSRIRNRGALPTAVLRQIEKEDDNIEKRKRQGGMATQFKRTPRIFGDVDKPPQRDSLRFARQAMPQKKNPEQLLAEAIKQTRAGQCSHCGAEGHFYRECAAFWQKVHESRQANLKK